MTDSQDYNQLHLEEVKERHEKDISEIKGKLEGVPERLDNVEKTISTLALQISDFIKELRKGYVSKETCSLCREKLCSDNQVNVDNIKTLKLLVYTGFVGAVGILFSVIFNSLKLL